MILMIMMIMITIRHRPRQETAQRWVDSWRWNPRRPDAGQVLAVRRTWSRGCWQWTKSHRRLLGPGEVNAPVTSSVTHCTSSPTHLHTSIDSHLQLYYLHYINSCLPKLSMSVWLNGNGASYIYEVALHWARLVLGWVTVAVFNSQSQKLISV